jgi:hypothetical protein
LVCLREQPHTNVDKNNCWMGFISLKTDTININHDIVCRKDYQRGCHFDVYVYCVKYPWKEQEKYHNNMACILTRFLRKVKQLGRRKKLFMKLYYDKLFKLIIH